MPRPEKYQDDFPVAAEGFARRGMSDEQIAKHLGISTRVYYEYQKKYPQFREAIARGKRPVDTEVENALLKCAIGGYEVIERRIETDANGNPVKQFIIKKILPPDAAACKFWLSIRQPKIWNEKLAGLNPDAQEEEASAVATKIVENMTYEERRNFLNEIAGGKKDDNK